MGTLLGVHPIVPWKLILYLKGIPVEYMFLTSKEYEDLLQGWWFETPGMETIGV